MKINLLNAHDADNERHKSAAVDPLDKDMVPILPVRQMVAFPQMKVPFMVSLASSAVIDDAMKDNHVIGLLTVKNPDIENPAPGELYEVGTMAEIVHAHKGEDGGLVVLLKGMHRFRVAAWQAGGHYLKAAVIRAPEIVESDLEAKALERQLRELVGEVMALMPQINDEAAKAVLAITDPLQLAYVTTFNLELTTDVRQSVLETDSLKQKMRDLLSLLAHEKDMLTMGKKIQAEVRQKMDKSKRDYMLRQQLAAIKKELGESGETSDEADDYVRRIEEADMPAEALEEARRELRRLQQMSPQSAEYSMIKTYLDWLLDLPWTLASEDHSDVAAARASLEEDHFGLHDVKERLIEFMAVRSLVKQREKNDTRRDTDAPPGAILCLTGPPGVGKTSLGQSVARALGRRFTRMSLGGVKDEAEIRGHRRTYIGAMPGRIIQAVKRAGTRNPVFMLDEIDKVGHDWRGDPSSALLEVLDPAQNSTFRDHYLDVDFDLSDVIFIATANQVDTIPGPLRDRMEMIAIDGYTEYEKLQIAKRHLVPRQLEAHGLTGDEATFMDEALQKIIQDYTRESGVRQLERHLAAICRKVIVQLNESDWSHVVITNKLVRTYLKKERFPSESSETITMPGLATGLAVTPVGGDILYIEATRMPGKGRLTLTGQLGAVMRESAEIASSYVRARAHDLAIDPGLFEHNDVHLHVPAGALPKDGPSAGVAMVLALASLFTGRPVRSEVGITGEITLRGRVLPVGGVKMKVLAAHRSGLTTVILPKRNERDLEDLPDEVRDAMTFVPVEHMDAILTEALHSEGPALPHGADIQEETATCPGGCYARPAAQLAS
jgi:ATP-dependent Lon protease